MNEIVGARSPPTLDEGVDEGCTGSLKAGVPNKLSPATGFTLHLPLPPSVNTFQRDARGRPLGNRSKSVKDWIRQGDIAMMLVRPLPHKVSGKVEVEFVWDSQYEEVRDADNMIKPLLDWLQRVELIDNDKKVVRGHWSFGDAPEGCIVTVRSFFYEQ